MNVTALPSPGALAGRHGAGLRASAEAVVTAIPEPVALVVRQAGATFAWALVDGRCGRRDVLASGLIGTDPAASEGSRFRHAAIELSALYPVLAALKEGLPAGRMVGVAYHGHGGAIGRLGDVVKGDDGIFFTSPADGDGIKALVAQATEVACAELRAAGFGHMTIATDGSLRRRGDSAGLGWVNSWGQYGYGHLHTSDILTAELAAIGAAAGEVDEIVDEVTFLVDSRSAIRVAQSVLADGPTATSEHVPAKAHRAMTSLHALARRVPVRVEWVRSHAGHAMNETADRLAVLARRTTEAGVPAEEVERMAAGVMADLRPTAVTGDVEAGPVAA